MKLLNKLSQLTFLLFLSVMIWHVPVKAETPTNSEVNEDCSNLSLSPEEFKQLLFAQKIPNRSIFVEGNLYLQGSTSLTCLPKNLSVEGELCLIGCTSLKSMSERLSVGGNLWINDCTSLTYLPEGLTVGGNLHLSECASLISLPNGLSVGGDLCLVCCKSLTSLPNRLNVGRNLNLSYCIGLTSLPDWITKLGHSKDGKIREVNLTGTKISGDFLDHLRNTPAPGMRFVLADGERVN